MFENLRNFTKLEKNIENRIFNNFGLLTREIDFSRTLAPDIRCVIEIGIIFLLSSSMAIYKFIIWEQMH